MVKRDPAISTIENLYGCPGAGYGSAIGERLLIDLFADNGGLALLSDDALEKLAQMHLREDDRRCSSYEKRA